MKSNISPSEVKSDNQIIAEFMGIDFTAKDAYLTYPPPICKRFGQYDRSWNWLMRAWQHFRQSCWNKIGYTDDFHDYWVAFRDAVFNGDIQEAHKATVEGIKWYNSQNQ